MATVQSVNTHQLLEEVSQTLKKEGIDYPEWARMVKTGVHTQRPPEDPDWWYTRAASILRKIYLQGPIGTNKLRTWYGGRQRRGSSPEKHRKAGGKIVRTCLQELEKAGLVKTIKGRGRVVTPKGQSLLEKSATQVKKAK